MPRARAAPPWPAADKGGCAPARLPAAPGPWSPDGCTRGPARWGPSLARSACQKPRLRAERAGSELLLSVFSPFSPPPTPQCQGLMSEECGRIAALAAARTRKGAGEEGLVSGEGHGSWQDWTCGGGPERRAAVPALLPGPSWPLGERVEGGPGAGRGGKLSRRDGLGRAVRLPGSLRSRVDSPSGCVAGAWTRGRERGARPHELGVARGKGGEGGGGVRVVPWDEERRRGLEPPATAPHGFLQVSPEGAGDEDSCSSSAPLSPSSSPRSMASGSVCPSGKCVCNSCGLEIVDKYLLKVGWSREAQGERGYQGTLGKEKSFFPPLFLSSSRAGCRLSQQNSPVQGKSKEWEKKS